MAGDKWANKIYIAGILNYINAPICVKYISRVVKPTFSSLEEFQKHDSRSALLSRILNLIVNTNKHNSLHAGYQIFARNYSKENVNQRANRGQYVFRVVCCCHSTPSSKNCGMGILSAIQVLNLADIEFPCWIKIRNSKILMTFPSTFTQMRMGLCPYDCADTTHRSKEEQTRKPLVREGW